ncbi:MAG: hypothetical protein P0Y53_09960 [Candidatus Pseudobacter hemicellulosilyticus]|uniref:Uncharacterized protein n=1 Tax=Candidatus Pseudobacter hemicellulosilyticus TaxID=3121375 RepID=A0AAJ5WT95_9BACT|nr:MAG: hypothetical protein P0Y53_09960 [Pseudobacter sp.]
MIPDKVFKSLPHVFKTYTMHSKGGPVQPGYHPDYVLRKYED